LGWGNCTGSIVLGRGTKPMTTRAGSFTELGDLDESEESEDCCTMFLDAMCANAEDENRSGSVALNKIPLGRVYSDDSLADVFLADSPRDWDMAGGFHDSPPTVHGLHNMSPLIPAHLLVSVPSTPCSSPSGDGVNTRENVDSFGERETFVRMAAVMRATGVVAQPNEGVATISSKRRVESMQAAAIVRARGWTNTIRYDRRLPKNVIRDCCAAVLGDLLLRPLVGLPDYDKIIQCVGRTSNTLACVLYLWHPHKQLLVYMKDGFARYAPEIHPTLAANIRVLRTFLPSPPVSGKTQHIFLCARPVGHWNLWKTLVTKQSPKTRGKCTSSANKKGIQGDLHSTISNSTNSPDDLIDLAEMAHFSRNPRTPIRVSAPSSPLWAPGIHCFGSSPLPPSHSTRGGSLLMSTSSRFPQHKVDHEGASDQTPDSPQASVFSHTPVSPQTTSVSQDLVHAAAMCSAIRHNRMDVPCRGVPRRRRKKFFTLTQAWTPNTSTGNE